MVAEVDAYGVYIVVLILGNDTHYEHKSDIDCPGQCSVLGKSKAEGTL